MPAQNMMRHEKALHWHKEIRAERARETGMWLVSADVTGHRDTTMVGLGPTCVIDPTGEVVSQVPAGAIGILVADINFA